MEEEEEAPAAADLRAASDEELPPAPRTHVQQQRPQPKAPAAAAAGGGTQGGRQPRKAASKVGGVWGCGSHRLRKLARMGFCLQKLGILHAKQEHASILPICVHDKAGVGCPWCCWWACLPATLRLQPREAQNILMGLMPPLLACPNVLALVCFTLLIGCKGAQTLQEMLTTRLTTEH